MQQSNSDIHPIPEIDREKIFNQPCEAIIESLAFLCFTPSEIALLCGLDEENFKDCIVAKVGEQAKAYYRGKLKYQMEQRIITAKFALKGSPDAEKTMQNYLNKMKEEENG